MKKILSLILSVVLLTGALTGCGKVTMEDIEKDPSVVVATIGEEEIYAYEMIYLMNMGYTKEDALNEVALLKASIAKAKEYGITPGDDIQQYVDDQIDALIQQYGTEEALNAEFTNLGITKEQYQEIIRCSYYSDQLSAKAVELGLFTEVSDDEILAFYDANFLRSQHILFATLDENNAPLSAEEIAAKKAQAEDTVAKIQGGQSFESFLNLSEDPGLETSPDGYTFVNTSADSVKNNDLIMSILQQMGIPMMVPEFEASTAALGNGEVSGIVESDYGYHIIKKLDIHGDGNEYEVFKPYISSVLNIVNYTSLVESWKAKMKLETNKYYEALTVEQTQNTAAAQ